MSNKENRFLIGAKAEDLLSAVFDITTSKKHTPVRFVRLAHRLEDYVLNIHSGVLSANNLRIDILSQKQKRYDLQTDVISDCDKAESLVNYICRKQLISNAVCESIVGLLCDIRNMTLSWRKT